MFADFLPFSATEIQDREAIALLQQIQRCIVRVPFQQGKTEVATAYAHYAADPSDPSQSLADAASDAAPILLLHGFDSSLLEFRRLFPFLAGRYETWAIDLFGSGFTQYVPPVAVNPQTIRQHLLSVLETCIHRPVILVGASLGGAVAIDFVLHHPTWVRSIVLIDSVGFSGSFPMGQFLPDALIELGADWLYFRKHAALTAASFLPAMNSPLVDALRCALLHQEMPGWKMAITAFTQSGGYVALPRRIAEITHPTLILWGEADDVLGTADATRFERAISSSQLVWIQRAGHAPHFDQPQVVAAHLLDFARRSRGSENSIDRQ